MKYFIIILSLILVFDGNAQSFQELTSFVDFSDVGDWKEGTSLRRGRSFGGSRRSSSRRSSSRRSTSSRSKRNTSSRRSSSKSGLAQSPKRPSFGGKRMSQSQARKTYSTPRKQETISRKSANGTNQRYVMNSYGGYGSGLMTGYMMGSSMWYWSMPFHPAFYYGRPAYVTNPDGSVGVYPPRFSFSRVFFTLVILSILGFIIYRSFAKKKQYNSNNYSRGSFA
ncbi:hypothetical protein OAQ99_01250 [Candidatus Kapabacteria bacterium]|nr:hypothetical protein [Candidatus Kapabacteria bacterium]